MPLNADRARRQLAEFNLETLFIEELGWDRYPGRLEIPLDGQMFVLEGLAEKRGMVAFIARSPSSALPDYSTRRKIERQAARLIHEHLIVYADGDQTTQVWQWVRREPGRPAACREHTYKAVQSGEALIQRLDALAFGLDEEAGLTIVDVARRARAAFDVERITKRFYERFKAEHEAFLGFISGLESQEDREWYASVTLNRLMFVYFIQRKGFLDDDRDYLRNRLRWTQELRGKDQFLSFYRHFLLRLFHEGLGQRTRSSELDKLVGKVPYLNGGLFDVHELEHANPNIQIPDDAFARLFDFFDSYQWHLDDRPLRADNEVNPDVLGYIFEKYINQKQMGAYYTKEDVTGYITAHTLLPCIFERVEKEQGETFEFAWQFLRDDPNRYIPAAVAHGCKLDLPADIVTGQDGLSTRERWNSLAAPEHALPNETWREVVTRRERHSELHQSLESGEVRSVNRLITENLDVRQWAQDVVENCESPEFLRQFYRKLERVTVLDPTCGSGAFLFAAMNLLYPLYEASLERMQAFVVESTADVARAAFADFSEILEHVRSHPNRTFFILKAIAINNLYGVDVMEEAVEICKLRLFLKLVSQIDHFEDLEPLPDIDFNIRAGNTLVGFARLADVKKAILGEVQTRLDVSDAMEGITAKAESAERAFENFRRLQLADEGSGDELGAQAKEDLRTQLAALRDELDRYLAGEYGINPACSEQLAAWRSTHHPFHWFAEFYGLMRDGGFDAVVGNPPYLEVAQLEGRYRPLRFETLSCRDIYAWVVERTFALRDDHGRIGLIVPVSISSSGSFAPLRSVIESRSATLWLSHFANRPGQLFAGAQNRLTIFLYAPSDETTIFSTRYHRWDAKRDERERLFALLRYVELSDLAGGFHGLLPKVGAPEAASILRKLHSSHTVAERLVHASEHPIFWVRVPGYFCQFHLSPPMARPEAGGAPRVRGEVNSVFLPDEQTQRVIHTVLNSSTYYQFYVAYSDGRHINPADVRDFTFDRDQLSADIVAELVELSGRLEAAARENTSLRRKSGLLIESLDSRPLKPLLDEIDASLARHYGFTERELDYLVNYDIKYRVGADGQESDDETLVGASKSG